jgi:hypothetical protein
VQGECKCGAGTVEKTGICVEKAFGEAWEVDLGAGGVSDRRVIGERRMWEF